MGERRFPLEDDDALLQEKVVILGADARQSWSSKSGCLLGGGLLGSLGLGGESLRYLPSAVDNVSLHLGVGGLCGGELLAHGQGLSVGGEGVGEVPWATRTSHAQVRWLPMKVAQRWPSPGGGLAMYFWTVRLVT